MDTSTALGFWGSLARPKTAWRATDHELGHTIPERAARMKPKVFVPIRIDDGVDDWRPGIFGRPLSHDSAFRDTHTPLFAVPWCVPLQICAKYLVFAKPPPDRAINSKSITQSYNF